MTTKSLMRSLEIKKVVPGGHSVPGGEYSDPKFALLLVWAARMDKKQKNRLRYENKFHRRLK